MDDIYKNGVWNELNNELEVLKKIRVDPNTTPEELDRCSTKINDLVSKLWQIEYLEKKAVA